MFNLFNPAYKKVTKREAQSITDKSIAALSHSLRERIQRNNQSTIDQYTAQNRLLKVKLAALEQFLGVEYVEETKKEYRKVSKTKKTK